MAQYDVFSTTFYAVGTQLLKQDEKAADNMAFTVASISSDCKQTSAQDLTDKFQTTIEKYGASA